MEGVQEELRNGVTCESWVLYDSIGRRLRTDADVYQAALDGLTPLDAHIGHGVCVGTWDMPVKITRYIDPDEEPQVPRTTTGRYKRKTGLIIPEILLGTLDAMSQEGFKHTAGTQKALQKQLQEAANAERKKFEATQKPVLDFKSLK